jgi:hypothetical protein
MYAKAIELLEALPVEQRRLIIGRYSAILSIADTSDPAAIKINKLECYCAVGAVIPASRNYEADITSLYRADSQVSEQVEALGLTLDEVTALQIVNDYYNINSENPLKDRYNFILTFMKSYDSKPNPALLTAVIEQESIEPLKDILC